MGGLGSAGGMGGLGSAGDMGGLGSAGDGRVCRPLASQDPSEAHRGRSQGRAAQRPRATRTSPPSRGADPLGSR
eukprot:1445120-Pyramimonas_sp.AAC.1